MTLDLTSLKNGAISLEKAIHSYNTLSPNSLLTIDDINTLKSGVIQNFEVAYELSWKFIQRWIRENRTQEDADNPVTRKELFRMAALFGLIEDPLPWFEYGNKRNMTSHTYDGDTAQEVFQSALLFLKDVQYLYKKLESAND